MARLHSIKQNGFNTEDATKINDVAKALKGVGVELLDNENNWRDMSDIFVDIADKWTTLDDKQKSYIATTMAGTRQQNVFFALMNDLSKGVENGSRAWELYTGALNAAGTATQKYSIWEESIAAAQGSLQSSLENLYATIVNSDAIKTFYGVLTGIVDGLNNMGGVAPIVGAALGALIITIVTMGHSAAVAAGETLTLAAAGRALTTAFAAHPLMLFATALMTLIPLLGTFGKITDEGNEVQKKTAADYSAELEKTAKKISSIKQAQSDINQLFALTSSETRLSTTQLTRYNTALSEVAKISPAAKEAVEQLKSGFGDQQQSLQSLNSEIETYLQNQKDAQKLAAMGR